MKLEADWEERWEGHCSQLRSNSDTPRVLPPKCSSDKLRSDDESDSPQDPDFDRMSHGKCNISTKVLENKMMTNRIRNKCIVMRTPLKEVLDPRLFFFNGWLDKIGVVAADDLQQVTVFASGKKVTGCVAATGGRLYIACVSALSEHVCMWQRKSPK